MKKQLLAAGAAAAMMFGAAGAAFGADVNVTIDQPTDGGTVAGTAAISGSAGAGKADAWNVVFVVDTSGSAYSTVGSKSIFAHEQDGAKALLSSLQSQSSDVNMGVVYFGSGAKGFGMSTDMNKINGWLGYEQYGTELSGVGGATSCELGLAEANKLLSGTSGNKRIYFLTDGGCNGYQKDLDAEVAKAKNAGIEVLSIHTTSGSEQCKVDDLKGTSCTYAEDPSKLAAQLPAVLAGELDSLVITVKDASGKVVQTTDLSGKLGSALTQKWQAALENLPDGSYTAEAVVKSGDATATDTVTFTVGDGTQPTQTPTTEPSKEPSVKPTPKPSKEPSVKPTPKPSETPTKGGDVKPGLPKTGN